MVKMNILVFEQEKHGEKTTYNLLDSNDYVNGINTISKKNINTYNLTRTALADANLTLIDMPLKKMHLEPMSKDDDIINVNGLFELLTCCITQKGTYYNAYVVIKTKIGLTYKKVKANPIILKNGDIIL